MTGERPSSKTTSSAGRGTASWTGRWKTWRSRSSSSGNLETCSAPKARSDNSHGRPTGQTRAVQLDRAGIAATPNSYP